MLCHVREFEISVFSWGSLIALFPNDTGTRNMLLNGWLHPAFFLDACMTNATFILLPILVGVARGVQKRDRAGCTDTR